MRQAAAWCLLVSIAVAACALLATAPVVLAARPAPTRESVVLKAIARLEAGGVVSPAEAVRDRGAVTRAVRLIDGLPGGRSAPVAAALAQVAALAGRLTAPRALVLFGQLTVNDDWFARRGSPASGTDISDADGIVYRYFPGAAFEFHPLANFTALNGAATSKNLGATQQLAAALIARGVPESGGGVAWEYYFGWEGGTAPWLSGFAQAVAAQAFARAALLLPSESSTLLAEANAAYRTIPGHLDRQLRVGPWIKLYGFNDDVVLNAQLQTAISLASYAANSGNGRAAALATSMSNAAARALPRFDTGSWTLYALPDDPSPLSYQEYVVQLLQTLGKTDSRFAADAVRFATYGTEPPTFKLADAGPGAVEFWVSKPATVRVSALGSRQTLEVSGGWHTVRWSPGHAGIFPVRIEATDWAGNAATAEALPIVRVVAPPAPAHKAKRRAAKPPVSQSLGLRARTLARAVATPPPLQVGAGLDEPDQAVLARGDGFDAVQMTLVWPSDASSPSPSAVAALDRLPAGSSLYLNLYTPALPLDATGRAALAAYAASLAGQVPALTHLILAPAPSSSQAGPYETALAAVYDAVKQQAPVVRIDGDLDGTDAPGVTLAAIAASDRSSGRTAPIMDDLAFDPAPAAGAGMWTLADLGQLSSALATDLARTTQPGGSPPLIIDDVGFASSIPAAEAALYQASPASPAVSEAAQAADYDAALATAGCAPTVSAVLLDRLVDGPAAGGQTGLYYPDGDAKTSLGPVLQAIDAAEGSTRDCTAAGPASASPKTRSTTTTATTATTPTTSPTSTATTPVRAAPLPAPGPLLASGSLIFPTRLSRTAVAAVHLGCTRACLYLVTLQSASDGAPMLANRGTLAAGASTSVTLPKVPIPAGAYRYAVFIVAQDEPGTVSIERSLTLSAG